KGLKKLLKLLKKLLKL
nr:antimicrobial peptide {immobilized peptide E16LKL} [synthetic, Peptide Synthetic, 16 aa] [synthetic construct]